MKELEKLQTMWAPRAIRTTSLIVPAVTYSGAYGSLNNESWAFNVPYAFRDALDIKYEQRMKDKQPYMAWTQGPLLRFRDGDLIHSAEKKQTIKINAATPMAWDKVKGKMYQGSVVFSVYSTARWPYKKMKENTRTQMGFLQLLIYGA